MEDQGNVSINPAGYNEPTPEQPNQPSPVTPVQSGPYPDSVAVNTPSPSQTPASGEPATPASGDSITISRSDLEQLVKDAVNSATQAATIRNVPTAVYTEPGSPAETLDAEHGAAGAVARLSGVQSLDGGPISAYLYDDGHVHLRPQSDQPKQQ